MLTKLACVRISLCHLLEYVTVTVTSVLECVTITVTIVLECVTVTVTSVLECVTITITSVLAIKYTKGIKAEQSVFHPVSNTTKTSLPFKNPTIVSSCYFTMNMNGNRDYINDVKTRGHFS